MRSATSRRRQTSASAIFCNHKRTPPKNWEESLKKKEAKLEEYRAKGNEAMARKAAMDVEFTKKAKDYNLNTSLKNYIDPRIYKSWCGVRRARLGEALHDLPPEEVLVGRPIQKVLVAGRRRPPSRRIPPPSPLSAP